jgi:hypothetical protein
MSENLTSREASEAMRLFLAQFNEREPEHRREAIFFFLLPRAGLTVPHKRPVVPSA